MKKTINENRQRVIDACDLCERECGNGFHNHCSICGRMCCLTCSRLIELADIDRSRKRRLLELPMKICHKCEEIGSKLHYAERIEAAVAGADVKTLALLDEWRALAKS